MKGVVKASIIGGIIIIIGIAILVTAFALSGWKLTSQSFETRTYTAEQDNSSIVFELGAGSINTEYYDGDKIVIEYPVSKSYTPEIFERNGALHYEAGFKHMWFFNTVNIPAATVKLPRDINFNVEIDLNAGIVNLGGGTYGKVDIEMSAGVIKAGAIVCGTLDCDLSAGTLSISSVECNSAEIGLSAGSMSVGDICCPSTRIDISAGSAKLVFDGAKSEYNISSRISAGSCNVSTQTGTTEKKINVSVSAGSCKLNFAG